MTLTPFPLGASGSAGEGRNRSQVDGIPKGDIATTAPFSISRRRSNLLPFLLVPLCALSSSCLENPLQKPGDVHYPHLNPYHRKTIELILSGEGVDNLKVTTGYAGDSSISGCRAFAGPGVWLNLSLSLPFEPSAKSPSEEHGVIVPDLFEPGKCNWGMADLDIDLPPIREKRPSGWVIHPQIGRVVSWESAQFHDQRVHEPTDYSLLIKINIHCNARSPTICHGPAAVLIPKDWPRGGSGTIFVNRINDL